MIRRPLTRRTRADGNKRQIVQRLEAHGVSVCDLEYPVDLLCGLGGVTFICEVKNPDTQYGRRGLNGQQAAFAVLWRGGKIYELRTAEDVDVVVAHVRGWARSLR